MMIAKRGMSFMVQVRGLHLVKLKLQIKSLCLCLGNKLYSLLAPR